MKTTLREIIISFCTAVDLYNYLLKNHHRRTAIAAYQIGKAAGLEPREISNLVISAAIHDIGAVTVQERDDLVHMDVENPHPHCEMGSYMLEVSRRLKRFPKLFIIITGRILKTKNGIWRKERFLLSLTFFIWRFV